MVLILTNDDDYYINDLTVIFRNVKYLLLKDLR